MAAKYRFSTTPKRKFESSHSEKVLSGPVDPQELDPRNIQGFFARNLAEKMGRTLAVEAKENSVTLIYV